MTTEPPRTPSQAMAQSILKPSPCVGGTAVRDFLPGVVPPKEPQLHVPTLWGSFQAEYSSNHSVPKCQVPQRKAPMTSIRCGTDRDLLIRDRGSGTHCVTLRGPWEIRGAVLVTLSPEPGRVKPGSGTDRLGTHRTWCSCPRHPHWCHTGDRQVPCSILT